MDEWLPTVRSSVTVREFGRRMVKGRARVAPPDKRLSAADGPCLRSVGVARLACGTSDSRRSKQPRPIRAEGGGDGPDDPLSVDGVVTSHSLKGDWVHAATSEAAAAALMAGAALCRGSSGRGRTRRA